MVTVVVPATVNVPLSVIAAPLVNAKSPVTVPCTANAVVVLSIVTCPVFPPAVCVVTVTAPVDAN